MGRVIHCVYSPSESTSEGRLNSQKLASSISRQQTMLWQWWRVKTCCEEAARLSWKGQWQNSTRVLCIYCVDSSFGIWGGDAFFSHQCHWSSWGMYMITTLIPIYLMLISHFSLMEKILVTIHHGPYRDFWLFMTHLWHHCDVIISSLQAQLALILMPPSLGTWNDFYSDFKLLSTSTSRMSQLHGSPLPLSQKPCHLEIISPSSKTTLPLVKSLMRTLSSTSSQEVSPSPLWKWSKLWTLSPPKSKVGTAIPCTLKVNGMQQMSSLADTPTTPTQHRKTTAKTIKANPRLIYTLWMSTQSTSKNSPRKNH